MAILGGVFLIGLALLRGLLFPPPAAGSLPSIVSEDIVPTPHLPQGVKTPTPSKLNEATAEPTLISPAIPPSYGVGFRQPRARFGEEPRTSPLFEMLNAADKEYPIWMIIPAIDLNAPIVAATQRKVIMDGKIVDMWFAPDLEAAGWHTTSALPGEIGNLVFSGHNNDFGKIFTRLIDLKPGDLIQVITQKRIHNYRVSNKVLFQEVEIELSQRMENARWISPSYDERVTLVTCWPYDSNTHRLIIVASPE